MLESLKQSVRENLKTSILNLSAEEKRTSSASILVRLKKHLESLVNTGVLPQAANVGLDSVSQENVNLKNAILEDVNLESFGFRKESLQSIYTENKKEDSHLAMSKTKYICLGAYKALPTEPDIAFEDINFEDINFDGGQGIQWAYPKTALNGEMSFYTQVTAFKKAGLGVLEPVNGEPCAVSDMDGVVVPALGFHTKGYRLGRGKGFFDKTFSQFKGIKIGVCFDFAYSETIPYEQHDIKMNYIITDKKVVETEKPVSLGEV